MKRQYEVEHLQNIARQVRTWWQRSSIAESNTLLQTAYTLIYQSLYWIDFFDKLIPTLHQIAHKLALKVQTEADAQATIASVRERLRASTSRGRPDGPTIRMFQIYDGKDFQRYRKMDQKSLENLKEALALVRKVTRKYINLQPTVDEDLI